MSQNVTGFEFYNDSNDIKQLADGKIDPAHASDGDGTKKAKE